MSALSAEALEGEIRRLHAFFVSWFAGRCPADDAYFDQHFVDHVAPDFVYIHPDGQRSRRDQLADSLRQGHGQNVGFSIAVEDVEVRFVDQRSATVCYVEVQRGAASTPDPDHRRLSTALFVIENGRRLWKHVHETWLPA